MNVRIVLLVANLVLIQVGLPDINVKEKLANMIWICITLIFTFWKIR